MITVGSNVQVIKGCKAFGIGKYDNATVVSIRELGAEYSHMVKVTLTFKSGFKTGRVLAFYARHKNRLSDDFVILNNGNPHKTIKIAGRDES